MVSDNQLDQYFQFVKDMLFEEVISELLIYSSCTTSIKTCFARDGHIIGLFLTYFKI